MSSLRRLSLSCTLRRTPPAAFPPLINRALSTATAPPEASSSAASEAPQTFAEIHNSIIGRNAPPPAKWFTQLARAAASTDDVGLVVAAHHRYIEETRFIGVRHTAELVRACSKFGDWDSLEGVLSDARRLQLHFVRPRELLVAFHRLDNAGERERLSRLHAALPRAGLERVQVGVLHDFAVKALARSGDVDAAAKALETAVGMSSAASAGPHHGVRLSTFSMLAEAQLEGAAPSDVGRTLQLALTELTRRGFEVWPASFTPLSKSQQRYADSAAQRRLRKRQESLAEGGEGEAEEGKKVSDDEQVGRLLSVAVRACLPPPPPSSSSPPAESEEAVEAAEGSAGEEGAAAVEEEGGGDAEAAAEEEEAAAVVDPIPIVLQLLDGCGAAGRASARASLSASGVEMGGLAEEISSALAK